MNDRKETADDRIWKRHIRIWGLITSLISGWIRRKFNFTYDDFGIEEIEGPVLVIPNHSCAWDPLLVGTALKKRQMYFVASEHILRWRIAGPVINWLVEPIPRKKASTGTGTVKACIRHLKAGHSVCLFAEGEQTWDGVTGKIFPATGKLVRQSGATLVTYCIEGAYLSVPRWASGVRRGKVHAHAAGVYSPEELKGMKPGEIEYLINRDLHIDTWKWQKSQPGGPVPFIGKSRLEPAKGLERALFMCPACLKTGTLNTGKDMIYCSCGFRSRFTQTGFLEPEIPENGTAATERRFCTIAEWDKWETSEMEAQLSRMLEAGEGSFFSDRQVQLSRVEDGHSDSLLCEGVLSLNVENGRPVMHAGDRSFDVTSIDMMAPVLSSLLLFSTGGGYYQIKAENTNLRKYVLAWQYCKQCRQTGE